MKRNAFIALCLFVFTIPWENSLVLTGFGTASRVAGLIAFLVGFSVILINRKHRALPVTFYLMTAYVLFGIVSLYWSIDPDLTITRSKTNVQLLIMAWMIWEFARDDTDVSYVLLAFILGGFVSIVGTFYSYYFHITPYVVDTRYVARGFDPNDLGLTLAIGIPVAWYLSAENRTKTFYSNMCRIYVLVSAITIVLTASRGGFIALIVALSYIPVTYGKMNIRQKILAVSLIVMLIYGLDRIVPETSFQRISTIKEEMLTGGMGIRGYIWRTGFELLQENPWFGVGAGAFKAAVGHYTGWHTVAVAHNTFISVLVEQGILGFSLFVGMLSTLTWRMFSLPLSERKLWMFVGCVWLTGVMALTWEAQKVSWLFFGLLMSNQALKDSNLLAGDKKNILD